MTECHSASPLYVLLMLRLMAALAKRSACLLSISKAGQSAKRTKAMWV